MTKPQSKSQPTWTDVKAKLAAFDRTALLELNSPPLRRAPRQPAEGRQDKQIAAAMKITSKKVSRWRSRFLTLGMAGLERDAARPGRSPTITASLVRRVVNMTTRQKPANATHWSTRSMAAAVRISENCVRRIWHGHGLKPHRVESFKISNDPESARRSCPSDPGLYGFLRNIAYVWLRSLQGRSNHALISWPSRPGEQC